MKNPKTKLMCMSFLFATSLFVPTVAKAGHEVGNGDTVPFEMPKVNFSYACDLLFRGQENASNFTWARKKIVFMKRDFKVIGGENGIPASSAYAVYDSASDGWEIETADDSKLTELPSFLANHSATLSLFNGGTDRLGELIVKVIVKGNIDEKEVLSGFSLGVPFRKRTAFEADVMFSSDAKSKSLGLTAKCRRVR